MLPAVRAYLRTPAALVWTLCGAAAVGTVFVFGWLSLRAVRSSAVGTNPLFLGGLGEILVFAVAALVVGLVWVVWLPFGAGVACAVGRRVRGRPAGFRRTLSAVLDARGGLADWLKTLASVGGLDERLLGEGDLARNEVAVGCGKFVVPALVLDSPTDLRRAVDRANRMTPSPGRERLLGGGIAAVAFVSGAAVAGSSLAAPPLSTAAVPLAVSLAAVGLVVTAAVDAAWRARAYAGADLSEGFRR